MIEHSVRCRSAYFLQVHGKGVLTRVQDHFENDHTQPGRKTLLISARAGKPNSGRQKETHEHFSRTANIDELFLSYAWPLDFFRLVSDKVIKKRFKGGWGGRECLRREKRSFPSGVPEGNGRSTEHRFP